MRPLQGLLTEWGCGETHPVAPAPTSLPFQTQLSAPLSLRRGHGGSSLPEQWPLCPSCLQSGPAVSFLLLHLIQMFVPRYQNGFFHSATGVS